MKSGVMTKECPNCGSHETVPTVSCASCGFIWNPADGRLKQNKRADTTSKHAPSVNDLCAAQFDWVERMGWHNKTVLEALALIASEVGEAVNECRGDAPTEDFGEELADICLRVFDLAQWQEVDLQKAILDKMVKNEKRGTRGRRI